jgi:hypothetical protein
VFIGVVFLIPFFFTPARGAAASTRTVAVVWDERRDEYAHDT